MVFPFVASLTDRSNTFEASIDRIEMMVHYIDSWNKLLVDHKKVQWVEEGLSKLRSLTKELKHTSESVFAPHCTSVMYSFKFHLPNHLVLDSKRFGSKSFTDAASFKHFEMLTKPRCRTTSRRLSTELKETVQSPESAVTRV